MSRELRKQVEERLMELVVGRQIFQRKPWTCVVLHMKLTDGPEEVFDFSKVQYPDRWDPERGAELAEQKAIAALARKLIKEHYPNTLRALGVTRK